MGSVKEYFSSLGTGIASLVKGLTVTGKEFVTPKITECYPENRDQGVAAERFRAENGAIVCRELLGLTRPKDDPTPSERTEAYYRKRPCPELIACAARIVGEQLLTLPADALHTKTAES